MSKIIDIKHDDPILRVFMLFMQMAQATYKYSDKRFFDANVSTATFIALKGLLNNGGVMTHSELAEWTNTEKHNITTLVDRMKKEGLVTSQYSQVDRRVAHITLTDKGRDAFDKAMPVSREIMNRIMHGISPEAAGQLEKLLGHVKTNMKREYRKLG